MATVYASFTRAGASGEIDNVPVFASPMRSEAITSSGTSAPGALIAARKDTVTIYCATALYATVGPAPVAAAANGIYIPPNVQVTIATAVGDKVAVIDA